MPEGAAAGPTDSLFVRLPEADGPMSAGKVLADLEKFGEISRLEVLRSDGGNTVIVSYFDERHAIRAGAALGERCSFAPCYGKRRLRLLGKARLERDTAPQVSRIELTEDGDYLVEFWDTRVAARVAATAYAVPCDHEKSVRPAGEGSVALEKAATPELSSAAVPAESLLQPAPSSCDKPRYLNDLRRSCIRWDDLASRREWRTVLLLRGLPRPLCEPPAMWDLLRARGLAEKVLEVRSATSGASNGRLGCALLRAASVDAVSALVRFFHGRQLGGKTPVAVSFATHQRGSRPTGDAPGLDTIAARVCCGNGGDYPSDHGAAGSTRSSSRMTNSARSTSGSSPRAASSNGSACPGDGGLPAAAARPVTMPDATPPPGLEACA